MSNTSNALLVTQILLTALQKAQVAAALLSDARGGDLTDAQVDASGLRADAELEKLRLKISGE